MKVCVTGGGGQVGRALADLGMEPWTRAELDITDRAAVLRKLRQARPDVVVHAAAWTAVDAAEGEPDAAWRVQREGTRHMVEGCDAVGAALITLSTDYVFPGDGGAPYGVAHAPGPTCVYGEAKLASEVETAKLTRHVVLRTSWVCSPHTGFVGAILRQAREGRALSVVSDQQGGPTPVWELARGIEALVAELGDDVWGTWHLGGEPHISWHGFAEALVEAAGLQTPVHPVRTADWPSAARRPLDARLDSSAFAERFGVQIHWPDSLARLVAP